MSATASMIGYSTTLQVNDGASATFVAIPECTEISTPNFESEKVEATNLTSPNRTREYLPGLVAPGSFSFTCRYTSAVYTRLIALKNVSKSWKITFPDALTATFSGILLKTDIQATVDGVIDIKCEGQASGAETLA